MTVNATGTESEPLLGSSSDGDSEQSHSNSPTGWQLAGLYVIHTLSTFNSRTYDFAAVLFIASAYPDHSIALAAWRGFSLNLASLMFAPTVGRWCNQHASRLRPLQICIVLQRACICIACFLWTMLVQAEGIDPRTDVRKDRDASTPSWLRNLLVAIILLLGMIEKTSWCGNIVVIERDWVPLLVTPSSKPSLHVLNANVKRIDLISKFLAPLAVSGISIAADTVRITAMCISAMQLVTVGVEVMTAMNVHASSGALRSPKQRKFETDGVICSNGVHDGRRESPIQRKATWRDQLRRYATSPVLLPSLAFVTQPLSVLALSASMIVYLRSVNFPLGQVTAARTLSTGSEIAATLLTPLLISWLRERPRPSESVTKNYRPLIIAGTVGISWQLCLLIPAVVILIILPNGLSDPTNAYPVLTKVLLITLALARYGPFAFALIEQQLVQIVVEPEHRVEFSGVEMALFSFAELSRWTLTGIFGKPQQFKVVAVASFGAVLLAAMLFWRWSWRWRERVGARDDG